MKKLYYLVNHEYRPIALPLVIGSLFIWVSNQIRIAQLISTGQNENDDKFYLRFEQAAEQAGIDYLFVAVVAFFLAIIAYTTHRQIAQKSMYTMYQLALPPLMFYTGKLIAVLIGFAQLIVIQCLSLWTAYYLFWLPAAVNNPPRQALLLAYLRSPFLRILVPIHTRLAVFIVLSWVLLAISVIGFTYEYHVVSSTSPWMKKSISFAVSAAFLFFLSKISLSMADSLHFSIWLRYVIPIFIVALGFGYRSLSLLSKRRIE